MKKNLVMACMALVVVGSVATALFVTQTEELPQLESPTSDRLVKAALKVAELEAEKAKLEDEKAKVEAKLEAPLARLSSSGSPDIDRMIQLDQKSTQRMLKSMGSFQIDLIQSQIKDVQSKLRLASFEALASLTQNKLKMLIMANPCPQEHAFLQLKVL